MIFTAETENQPIVQNVQNPIGIDAGLKHYATLSNGEKISNPRFFRTDEKALAKANRCLSKEKKGTAGFKKRVKVLQKIYRRIRNRRNNFAHQLSRKLVNSFDAIFFEDLNISGMMKNRHLAKSIGDAAWRQTISFTRYKAENAGLRCETVNPKGTSGQCSKCGEIVKKDLSQRTHHCTKCGLNICRDINAAKNILRLGLQSLGIKSLEAALFKGVE